MRIAAAVLACTVTACSYMTVQKPTLTETGHVSCTSVPIAPAVDMLLGLVGVVTIVPAVLSAAIFFPSARYGFRHTARCTTLRAAVREGGLATFVPEPEPGPEEPAVLPAVAP